MINLESAGTDRLVMSGFITLLCENKDENGDLTAWLVEEKTELNRGLMGLNDLTYLLSVVPAQHLWSDKLRANFRNGTNRVLEVLSLIQGIDQMKRQTGQHVEMEDNGWKITYELQTHFGEVVRLITAWAVTDRSVMVQLIEETLRLINLKHGTAALKEKSKYLAFLGLISVKKILFIQYFSPRPSQDIRACRFRRDSGEDLSERSSAQISDKFAHRVRPTRPGWDSAAETRQHPAPPRARPSGRGGRGSDQYRDVETERKLGRESGLPIQQQEVLSRHQGQ